MGGMTQQDDATTGWRMGPVTVLADGKTTTVPRGLVSGDNVWLREADLSGATGWEIKPEGVCRDEMCVPLSGGWGNGLLREEEGERWLDVTAFARHIEQPYVQESGKRVWSFGPPAHEWERRAASNTAPDFTLPDFNGRPRSLSEFLGKKVFLLTWASW
jgi:hypothetical protein